MASHCLVLLIGPGGLLLARKRRGFGAGRLVAPGGKVEPGETPRDAAARELHEETGLEVAPGDLAHAGRVRFRFNGGSAPMDVALYRGTDWAGEPVGSDELEAPAFYPIEALPLPEMWVDNPYWLPQVLRGESVEMTITYDAAASTILEIAPRLA